VVDAGEDRRIPGRFHQSLLDVSEPLLNPFAYHRLILAVDYLFSLFKLSVSWGPCVLLQCGAVYIWCLITMLNFEPLTLSAKNTLCPE